MTWLDRRTAHESQIGNGLAGVPETGDDFLMLEYIAGAFGICREFDGQVGLPVSIVAVHEVAGGPVCDGKKAGAQDGGTAMLACFDQERNFQGSGRAPDPVNDIMLFQPGFAAVRVAQGQADLSCLLQDSMTLAAWASVPGSK